MAIKVAFINMKGGVGKSTLTVNLAWYFALPNNRKRVLVVDLDPQFNASQYLLGTSEYLRVLQSGQRTVWDVFEQRTRHPEATGSTLSARDVLHNRVTISPGGGRIDAILSRLELAFSLKTPYQQKEQEAARLLAQIDDESDLILIDCAPTESLLTLAKEDVRTIARRNQWHVFDAEVPYSRSFPKRARLGVSIFSTPNARRRQQRRCIAFANEFARRIGL